MQKSTSRFVITISCILIISIGQVSWFQNTPSWVMAVSLLAQGLLCIALYGMLQNSYLVPL